MNNNNNGLVIGITMVVVLLVGFLVGRMTANEGMSVVTTGPNQTQTKQNTDMDSGAENTATNQNEGTEVKSSQMTDGQRKMLETMGIDPNNVTITPEMVACAEAKVGAARVAEIQGGATPSIIEGGKLFACYTSS